MIWTKLVRSLPFRLLILQMRQVQMYLLVWVVLWALLTGFLGAKFGIRHLFMDPEYLGNTGFLAFFITGVCLGFLFMAWQIACYISYGPNFPYLGALKKPFLHFQLNNGFIPLVFLILYGVEYGRFSSLTGVQANWLSFAGLVLGVIGCAVLIMGYFILTNRDVSVLVGKKVKKKIQRALLYQRRVLNKGLQWTDFEDRSSKADYFLSLGFKFSRAGEATQYEYKSLLSVIRQNHLNALLIQVIGLLGLIALGFLAPLPLFRIPAGGSIFILFAVLIMFYGAFTFWLRSWALPVFGALLILYVVLSPYAGVRPPNEAYGLDYRKSPVKYTSTRIDSLNAADIQRQDSLAMIARLEAWRKGQKGPRPVMTILAVSGGGMRAALFAFAAMDQAQTESQGAFFGSVPFMTGASGGMLGAAYYRDLAIASGRAAVPGSQKALENLGMDLLNPLCFTLITNDILFPWRKWEFQGKKYNRDRGQIFEQTLRENLHGALNHPLEWYRPFEDEGRIPFMVVSPVILQDGRQLHIASSPVSWMTPARVYREYDLIAPGGVDFNRLLGSHGADSLNFLSALRMACNFPVIMPNTVLPTQPPIEVVDAGLRDNLGMENVLRFLSVFQDWIRENTAGLVVLQIRSARYAVMAGKTDQLGLSGILSPLADFYKNWSHNQEFMQTNSLEYLTRIRNFPLRPMVIEYIPDEQGIPASLSWHLTHAEKESLLRSLEHERNRQVFQDLARILRTGTLY